MDWREWCWECSVIAALIAAALIALWQALT
mgnify:CR=1 FL=1